MREYVLVYDTGGGIKEVELNEGVRRISGSSSLTTLESHLLEHAAILGSSYQFSSKEYIRVKNEGGGIRDVPVTQGVNFVRSYSDKVTFDGHLLEHTAMDNDIPLSINSNEYVLVYDTGGGSRQVPVIDGCLFIEGERYLSTYSDHNNIHGTTGIPPGLNIPSTGRTMLACLTSSLILDEGTGEPTWSRATKAWGFNELGYLEELASVCAFFGGARLVRNTVRTNSEDFSNAAWSKIGSVTIQSANTLVCAAATATMGVLQSSGPPSVVIGQHFLYGARVRYVSGGADFVQILSGSAGFDNDFMNVSLLDGTSSTTGGVFSSVTEVVPGTYDIVIRAVADANAAGDYFSVVFANSLGSPRDPAFIGDGVKSFELLRAWSVDVTGYDLSYIPEYISVGVEASPYFGAGIDGVKYFEIDWQGAPIAASNLLGFRREAMATNNLLWCRDLSNAAWTTKTNITAAKTATGLDGIVNTATTLTATAADATILQPITLASAARCASAYVKRRTGTGTISFTQDGGSTWTDITAQINGSTWSRVQITSTLVNPSTGFKISTSGDEIDVDCVQNEAGAVSTSLIVTTTATVTRNADSLTYPTAGNIGFSVGTLYGEIQAQTGTFTRQIAGIGTSYSGIVNNGVSNWRAYDGTTIVTKSGLSDIRSALRKRAISWGGAGLTSTGDGLVPAVGVFSGTFAAGATMVIGSNANGYIRNVVIYNYQMTDAELQAITS